MTRHPKPARKRRVAPVRYCNTVFGDGFVLLPIRLVSESNVREHWAVKNKRRAQQRSVVALALRPRLKLTVPVTITITRIGPKALDGHDNLARSAKAVVDQIAQWLGIDDADPRVTWRYAQEPQGTRVYGVKIAWEALPKDDHATHERALAVQRARFDAVKPGGG